MTHLWFLPESCTLWKSFINIPKLRSSKVLHEQYRKPEHKSRPEKGKTIFKIKQKANLIEINIVKYTAVSQAKKNAFGSHRASSNFKGEKITHLKYIQKQLRFVISPENWIVRIWSKIKTTGKKADAHMRERNILGLFSLPPAYWLKLHFFLLLYALTFHQQKVKHVTDTQYFLWPCPTGNTWSDTVEYRTVVTHFCKNQQM